MEENRNFEKSNKKDEKSKDNSQPETSNSKGSSESKKQINVKDSLKHEENTGTENISDDEAIDLPDNFFDDFSNTDFMEGLNIVDDWIDESAVDRNSSQAEDSDHENYDKYHNNEEIHKEFKKYQDKPYERRGKYQRRRSNYEWEQKKNYDYYRDRESGYRRPYRRYKNYTSRFYNRSKERSLSRGRRSRDKSPITMKRSRDRSPRDRSPYRVNKSKEYSPYKYHRSQDTNKFSDKYFSRYTEKSPNKYAFEGKSESQHHTDMPDSRRDPEKTRRDIQRDKLRCKNDLKARVFQEQLKVAETGLVPPGTELEVVLQNEKFNENLSKGTEEVDLRVHLRQKRKKYFDQLSPVSDARTSPESMVSEREMWLRNRPRMASKHRKLSSPSSVAKHPDERHKWGRSKPSFLEEILQKLRDPPPTSQPKYYREMPYNPSVQNFAPAPQPFQMEAQPTMGLQPYPQPCMQEMQIPVCTPEVMSGMMAGMGSAPMPVPVPLPPPCPLTAPHSQPMMDPGFQPQSYPPLAPGPHPANVPTPEPHGRTGVAQLLEDKKITLSDYLSASTRQIDPHAPAQVQTELEVIARCNEVIDALADDKHMIGRFFPKIRFRPQLADSSVPKNTSPLRRLVAVQYQYTTSPKVAGHKTEPFYMMTLWKLMAMVGLAPSALAQHSLHSIPELAEGRASPDPAEPAARPRTPAAPRISPPHRPPCHSQAAQTEPDHCEQCEARAAVRCRDQAVQTEPAAQAEASTQVHVDELTTSFSMFMPRGILKNSSSLPSLVHLTPAQILAQTQKEKQEDGQRIPPRHEMFPVGPGQDGSHAPSYRPPEFGRVAGASGQPSPADRLSGHSTFPTGPPFGGGKPGFGPGAAPALGLRPAKHFPGTYTDPYRPSASFMSAYREPYDKRFPADTRGRNPRGRGTPIRGYGNVRF